MKKMPKLRIALLTVFLLVQATLMAQNCADYIIYRSPTPPYKLDSQSKSATCETGKTYKLVLALSKGKDYRLSFYASAVFDNKISFKIVDKSSGKAVVDLPGESENNDKGTAVLRPYLSNGKMVHPYFDFLPDNATNLEVIIDVKSNPKTGDEPARGCIGVFLQNKVVENIGFNN